MPLATLLGVRSTVESLEGNKVKVVVEVEEAEFEKELDAAFTRLASQVNLPGFRPGRAPRKVLEARIGQGYARDEAFREALPNYYTKAVIEHDVDVIAPPEIDITAGQEAGPVTFDAVVEVRPSVTVSDYDSLEIEVPAIEVSDEDVTEAVDRMRGRFGELTTVDRAAINGDSVVIDIAATHAEAEIPGMTTEGYTYEVGSGATGIDAIDENLLGASAGDELSFDAPHPEEDEEAPINFEVKVNEVQENVLPEPTDEWVSENSEFATLEDLEEDYRDKMERSRISQAITARRNGIANKVAELVGEDDCPEAMVNNEVEGRVQDMALRLQAQGMTIEQFMQFSGQGPDEFMETIKVQAGSAARMDLALRSIAEQENLVVADSDIDEEIAKAAEQYERPVEELREQFVEAGQLSVLRADLLKAKTIDWLTERVRLVDEDGRHVPSDALELPEEELEEDEE